MGIACSMSNILQRPCGTPRLPPPPPDPFGFVCDFTDAQMTAYVDSHPDQADEVLAYVEAHCPSCKSINWLRGYCSARDPGVLAPT